LRNGFFPSANFANGPPFAANPLALENGFFAPNPPGFLSKLGRPSARGPAARDGLSLRSGLGPSNFRGGRVPSADFGPNVGLLPNALPSDGLGALGASNFR
jgi:hypothetical protein